MTFLRLPMSWKAELSPGPVPLWFQIADRLRSAIAAGEFKPGDALPSEAELNAVFGVSRTTARTSLDRLKQEGLISRRSGRGSIVLKPRIEQPATELASFSEDMRRHGSTASYATESAVAAPATAEVAEELGLEPGASVFRIQRLLRTDGDPIGMSVSWLSPAILGEKVPTRRELDAGSLYDWLDRHCGARVTGAREFIEAEEADPSVARGLDVPVGSAVLVVRRRSHGANGDPIEYAVMYYRADRYRFRIDLVRR